MRNNRRNKMPISSECFTINAFRLLNANANRDDSCWSPSVKHDSREFCVSNVSKIAEMHIFHILNKRNSKHISYANQLQRLKATVAYSTFIFIRCDTIHVRERKFRRNYLVMYTFWIIKSHRMEWNEIGF